MTLAEKVALLQSELSLLKTEITSALSTKGLKINNDGYVLKDVPSLIRKIRTQGFDLFFDFKNIPVMETLHVLNLGSESHFSSPIINAEFADVNVPNINFINSVLVSQDDIQFNGMYGVPDGFGVVIDLEPNVIQPIE